MTLAFFYCLRHVPWTLIPSHRGRTLHAYGREILVGWKRSFLTFDPHGGPSFCDRVSGLLASPTFLEPPRVARVRSKGDSPF